MDNHSYNLVSALSEKAESTWVYDKYIKDSKACRDCKNLWKMLKNEENKFVEVMKKLLVSHAKTNAFK